MPHTSICPPYICTAFCTSIHLHIALYICMVPYTICSPYVMGTWETSVHPICLGVRGASVHLSGIFVSVGTSIASQFMTVIPVALHHGGLLLYWTECLWMSTMLHAVVPLLVVFPLCLKLLLLQLWLLLLKWLVCSGTSSLLSTVYMAPSLMGLPATSGQNDLFLLLPLTPRNCGGVVGLATVPLQQHPSQMLLQADASYAMGFPQVGFSFRVEPPTILFLYMFDVCPGVCFLLSGAMLHSIFTYGGSPVGICAIATLWSLPLAGTCATWKWSLPTPGMHRVAASSTDLSRGSLLLIQLSSSHSNYMVGHTALGLGRESPNPCTFPAWWWG